MPVFPELTVGCEADLAVKPDIAKLYQARDAVRSHSCERGLKASNLRPIRASNLSEAGRLEHNNTLT